MPPTLEKVLTLRAVIDKKYMLMLGSTKGGTARCCGPNVDGFLKGSGINATTVIGSCDWPLIDSTSSTLHLDGRYNFRDDSTGDTFYMTLIGVMRQDEHIAAVLGSSGEPKATKGGDPYWFASPTFEVSNEKHKWMEQSWFVSQGHWEITEDGKTAAEHEIYRVVPG